MENKIGKKGIMMVLVAVLGITILLSASFAFYTYSKTSSADSVALTGDIYLNYIEGDNINLTNLFPLSLNEALTETSNLISFQIKGKNTNTANDIYYDIVLSDGESVSGKTRLNNNDIHFQLIEEVNGTETILMKEGSYGSYENGRIYVGTFPKNTQTEVTKTYKLRFWLSGNVLISDTDANADYKTSEWKNGFASVKITVNGDFNKKDVNNTNKTYAVNYQIAGNSIQNGTPSIDNPIDLTSLGDSGKITLKTYGKNLIKNSQILEKNDYTSAVVGTKDSTNLYNGCSTLKTTTAWLGYKINFKKIAEDYDIKVGDKVTYSIYAKLDGIPTANSSYSFYVTPSITGVHGTSVGKIVKDVVNDWQQLSYSFTVTEDFLNVTSMRIESNYYESSNYTTTIANVIFACPQLELNDKATDYEKYVDPVTSTISIANHEPLRSIDTSYDYIDYENNRIVRNIRHVSLSFKDMNNSNSYPGWVNAPYVDTDFPNDDILLYNKTAVASNINTKLPIRCNSKNGSTLYFTTDVFGLNQNELKNKYGSLTLELYYKMPTPIYEPLNLPRTLINSSSGHVVAYDENLSSSNVSTSFVTK